MGIKTMARHELTPKGMSRSSAGSQLTGIWSKFLMGEGEPDYFTGEMI